MTKAGSTNVDDVKAAVTRARAAVRKLEKTRDLKDHRTALKDVSAAMRALMAEQAEAEKGVPFRRRDAEWDAVVEMCDRLMNAIHVAPKDARPTLSAVRLSVWSARGLMAHRELATKRGA